MIAKFGKSLESFNRRIRPHIYPSYRRAYRQMLARGMRDYREGEPLVVCDFSSPAIDEVGGRYFASMVRDLMDAGYFPVMMARRATLPTWITSRKKALLLTARLGVIKSLDEIKSPFMLITDRSDPPPALAEKVVRVDYAWRLCRDPAEIELPFFVHPQVGMKVSLPHGYSVEEKRTTRLFFGGNTTEGRYDKNVLGDLYRMLTRREMLAGAAAVVDHVIYQPLDADEWLESSEFHPYVIFETQHHNIPHERWIDALAKADFFLACPGVGMPMCHNLIESLAGGAIPILQYGDYMTVPLENGVNCLDFQDAGSLMEAIRTALAMDQESIRTLRANVRAYYDEHLAPGRFARRLFSAETRERTLLINAYRVPR